MMRLWKLVGWPDKDDEGWLGPMAGATEADGRGFWTRWNRMMMADLAGPAWTVIRNQRIREIRPPHTHSHTPLHIQYRQTHNRDEEKPWIHTGGKTGVTASSTVKIFTSQPQTSFPRETWTKQDERIGQTQREHRKHWNLKPENKYKLSYTAQTNAVVLYTNPVFQTCYKYCE